MIFTRFQDMEGPGPWEKLRIEGARPRERMVSTLMKEIASGLSPWAKLDGDPLKGLHGIELLPGTVLTIWDDYGHHYIYKVLGYDFEADLFELEWPD